jgi:hypothetical protein
MERGTLHGYPIAVAERNISGLTRIRQEFMGGAMTPRRLRDEQAVCPHDEVGLPRAYLNAMSYLANPVCPY